MIGNHVDHFVNLNFFKHIRSYNSSLSFASFTANVAPPPNHGPPCFRVCRPILHHVGNLRPDEGFLPTYCQLHIYDANAAVSFRMEQQGNDCCIHELMQVLQTTVSQENPYLFRNMLSMLMLKLKGSVLLLSEITKTNLEVSNTTHSTKM